MAVVSEKEILSKLDVAGLSDETREGQIRAVLEKMGVDFGRTVHCRGEHPTREWTNTPNDFEPTAEEKAAAAAAAKAKELAELTENEVQRKRIEALEAQLAIMSNGKTAPGAGTISIPKPTK